MRSFFVLVCRSMCATAMAQVDTTSLLDLGERARESGSVSNVVVVDVIFEVEGRLSSNLQVEEQRSRIRQAQQVLLEGLSSRNTSGIKTIVTVPFVAHRVDEESLLSLA